MFLVKRFDDRQRFGRAGDPVLVIHGFRLMSAGRRPASRSTRLRDYRARHPVTAV
jgi:hypothetical protein